MRGLHSEYNDKDMESTIKHFEIKWKTRVKKQCQISNEFTVQEKLAERPKRDGKKTKTKPNE